MDCKNILLLYKVLSRNSFQEIKPDPDFIKEATFRFNKCFFDKYFESENLSIKIESIFDIRQTSRTFKLWKEKVLKQINQAGVNYFAGNNLKQFNEIHDNYVQKRVEKKISQIVGWGAFAKQDIKRGYFLGFYAGHYKKALDSVPPDEQSYYFDWF